jgi:hypothetical protein
MLETSIAAGYRATTRTDRLATAWPVPPPARTGTRYAPAGTVVEKRLPSRTHCMMAAVQAMIVRLMAR